MEGAVRTSIQLTTHPLFYPAWLLEAPVVGVRVPVAWCGGSGLCSQSTFRIRKVKLKLRRYATVKICIVCMSSGEWVPRQIRQPG